MSRTAVRQTGIAPGRHTHGYERMNTESYRALYLGGSGEITEKKSRFIATLLPVKTEEEALVFIEQIKKKYWDAKHNCSAYVIGRDGGLTRCSDDGEPPHTAGRPMLDVLLAEGISEECCSAPAGWCAPIRPPSRRDLPAAR